MDPTYIEEKPSSQERVDRSQETDKHKKVIKNVFEETSCGPICATSKANKLSLSNRCKPITFVDVSLGAAVVLLLFIGAFNLITIVVAKKIKMIVSISVVSFIFTALAEILILSAICANRFKRPMDKVLNAAKQINPILEQINPILEQIKPIIEKMQSDRGSQQQGAEPLKKQAREVAGRLLKTVLTPMVQGLEAMMDTPDMQEDHDMKKMQGMLKTLPQMLEGLISRVGSKDVQTEPETEPEIEDLELD